MRRSSSSSTTSSFGFTGSRHFFFEYFHFSFHSPPDWQQYPESRSPSLFASQLLFFRHGPPLSSCSGKGLSPCPSASLSGTAGTAGAPQTPSSSRSRYPQRKTQPTCLLRPVRTIISPSPFSRLLRLLGIGSKLSSTFFISSGSMRTAARITELHPDRRLYEPVEPGQRLPDEPFQILFPQLQDPASGSPARAGRSSY